MKTIKTTNVEISTAKAQQKATTFGFTPRVLKNFKEVAEVTSRFAYAVGTYKNNGHRKLENLTNVSSMIIYDIDNGLSINSAKSLIQNTGFEAVIVTTRSHRKYKYLKDGITIKEMPKDKYRILINGCNLELDVEADRRKANTIYKSALKHIAEQLGILQYIDLNAIDSTRHYAPNSEQEVTYFEGKLYDWADALEIATLDYNEQALKKVEAVSTSNELLEDIDSILLADGVTVTSVGAEVETMAPNETRACFCNNPNHNDSNASAFIFNNEDGTQGLHCTGCGHHQVLVFKPLEDKNALSKNFEVFNNNSFIYKDLVPSSIASGFRDDVWLAKKYGHYPKTFLKAHTIIGSAFNKIISNNENKDETASEMIRIPSPTGSGKSEFLIYYTAKLAQKLKDDDKIGVLIVTKFKSECDRIVEGINNLLEGNLAAAYHSDSPIAKNDLKYTSILVTTHTAFEIRAKGNHRMNLEDIMMREPLAGENFERNFCVVDETISLSVQEQLINKDISRLSDLLRTIRTEKKKLLKDTGLLEQFNKEFEVINYLGEEFEKKAENIKGKKMFPLEINLKLINEQMGYKSDFGEYLSVQFKTIRKVLKSPKFEIAKLVGVRKASKDAQVAIKSDTIEKLNNLEKGLAVTDWCSAYEGTIGFYSAADFFPQKTSFAILDATASLDYSLRRDVPSLPDRQKTLIVEGLEDIRKYDNVTLNYTFTQTGKNAVLNPKNQKRFSQFIEAIEAKIGKDKKTLLVSHKDAKVWFESLSLESNYQLDNWGNLTGKNDWKDCEVVALYGLLWKPEHLLVNHFLLQSGVDYALSEDGLKSKQKYEYEDLTREIVQAVNRIRTRIVVDEFGNCKPAEIFVTLPKGQAGMYILNKILQQMPGLKTEFFNFEIQDARLFSGANQKRIVETLDRLCHYDKPLAAVKLKDSAAITRDSWKGLKKNKSFFKTLLEVYGYDYEQLTKTTARFVKISKGTRDEADFNKNELEDL